MCLLLSSYAGATSLALQNLDADEYKAVVREFSANFTHTAVSGASAQNAPFGFQFGMLTGRTNSPNISERVGEVIPGRTRSSLPHLAALASLKIPLGLTVETGFLPKTGTDHFKYTTFSLAAKWSPTDIFDNAWLHFAVKGHAQKSYVEFDYDISSTPTRFEYRSVVSGVSAFLSADITPMIEPYFAVGLLKGSGELKVSGSNTVFSDPEYQAASSAKVALTSPLYLFGVDFKMGVIGFGLEYSRQFNTDTYNGKFMFVPF